MSNSALALSAINQLRLILIPCSALWPLAKKYNPPDVSFIPDAANEEAEQFAWQLLSRDIGVPTSIVGALKRLSELAESGGCEELRGLSAWSFAHKLGQVLQLTPQADPSTSDKAARLWRCQWTRIAKAIREWGDEPGWGWMQGELDEQEMRMQGKLPAVATDPPEEISVSAEAIQLKYPQPPDNLVIAAQHDVAVQLADIPDFDVPSSGLIADLHNLNGHTTAAAEWAVFRLIEAGCLHAFVVHVGPKGADRLPCMLVYPSNLGLRPTQALWELWRNGKPAGGIKGGGPHGEEQPEGGKRTKPKRTRGRPQGSITRKSDLKLWSDYRAACRTAKVTKAEFIRDRGLDSEEGLAALDRGRKATKTSPKDAGNKSG